MSIQQIMLCQNTPISYKFAMIPTGTDGSSTFTDTGTSPVVITNTGTPTIVSNRLNLPGSSYLQASKDSAFNTGANNFIYKVVFKTTSTLTYATLMSRGDSTFSIGSGSWTMFLNNGGANGFLTIYDAYFDTSNPAFVSTVSYSDGVEHTAIYRRVGNLHTLEADGVVIASRSDYQASTPRADLTNHPLVIGSDLNFGPRTFVGTIGEVSLV